MATTTRIVGLIAAVLAFSAQAQEADLPQWAQGDWGLNLRYRFEGVDDNINRNAKASTLRAAFRYDSAEVMGWSLTAEVEHVSAVGGEKFNDGGSNGKTRYAVVADPDGTEIDQAYVQFTGLPGTQIRYGRQMIVHRPYPANRFLGSVAWRQNRQSFDGFHLENTAIEGLTVNAGYIHNVNRIFGEDNKLPNRSDHDLDAWVARAVYSGFGGAAIEGYFYDLDFTNAVSLSTRTLGLRAAGQWALNDSANLLYAVEGAKQKDVGDNPNDLSLSYWLLDLGVGLPNWQNLTVKLSHERLEGDGTVGFSTPLATLHGYQGWTDKFLATPAMGVLDTYLTARAQLGPVNLLVAYHTLSSERGSFDYGQEWGFMATAKPMDRVTVGFKFADYNADRNASNTGATAVDATKFWGWIQFAL